MTARREGMRRRILFIVLVLGTMGMFACGHGEDLPFDVPVGRQVQPGVLGIPEKVVAALAAVRMHDFMISFVSVMKEETIVVRVADDLGNEEVPELRWSSNASLVHATGPWRYCRTYTITVKAGATDVYGNVLEEDAVFEAAIGPNPGDVDKTCTADIVVSRPYEESLDAVIIPADEEMAHSGANTIAPSDLDSGRFWYLEDIGRFTDAGPIAVIPGLAGNGAAGAAQLSLKERRDPNTQALLSTHYELDLWGSCTPGGGAVPDSSIFYDVGGNSRESLIGPSDAGDLNGDGLHEVLLSGEIDGNGLLLQRVFLLPGLIHRGYGFSLEDEVLFTEMVGDFDRVHSPFVPVGDVNVDGFGDLGAVTYKLSSINTSSNWKIELVYGREDLSLLFRESNVDVMIGGAGRETVGLDAADVNGDGGDDLIVADLKRKYVSGAVQYSRPRVSIIMGRQADDGFEDFLVDDADANIFVYLPYPNTVTSFVARAIGDVNADGLQDIAAGVTTRGSSALYLILGRETWWTGQVAGPHSNSSAAVYLEGDAKKPVILRDAFFDGRVGDVNNDGYSDFMVRSPRADGVGYYLFLGDPSLSDAEHQKLTLDDAHASFFFSAP